MTVPASAKETGDRRASKSSWSENGILRTDSSAPGGFGACRPTQPRRLTGMPASVLGGYAAYGPGFGLGLPPGNARRRIVRWTVPSCLCSGPVL
jgi:hypothetical protein